MEIEAQKNPAAEIERLKKKLRKREKIIRELRVSNLFLESLFNGISEEILVLDNDFNIMNANEVFLKRYEIGKNNILGQKCYEIKRRYLAPCNVQGEKCPVKRARESGSMVEETYSYKDCNGEDRDYILITYPLRPDGEKIQYFLEIARDVSEQRQMECRMLQSERLAAVGKAVAHVAHELKNPLMIIGGFSNQIKANIVNEKDRKKIEMVLDEVQRLERLVANLGDFTKEYRLVTRQADINSVIRDVVKIMAGVYEPDKYRFEERLSDDMKEMDCDPDKLKQVFLNIISNGLDAMTNGGIISITTEKIGRTVEIKIKDTGKGISEEDMKNIFEPFFTTRERGSGLGLAISYKLIRAHDGEIRATSKKGEGTTFFIQLPCA